MSIKALHIYSYLKKEELCEKAMISIYNKIHNPHRMNKTLAKGRYFYFVLAKGVARNGRRETQVRFHCLQKQKDLQCAWMGNVHTFLTRGMIECDQLFLINTPNGEQRVTLKQILISIKTQSNYKLPLFTGFEVQPDGSILILFHISMK